ncbi:MAG: bacteriohemerythrin [Desulforhopalus sp.]|nr:bacteriohemerythrin [Desulforhopalus sp.]
MAQIEWDSAWNIGHVEIDEQHQRWVELFNQLERAFLGSADSQDLTQVQKDVFQRIRDYTRYHFACEEKVMQAAAWPGIPVHWRFHKEFDQVVYERYREFENGDLVLTSELLALIRNWLLHHIQVEDLKFGEYLRQEKNTGK